MATISMAFSICLVPEALSDILPAGAGAGGDATVLGADVGEAVI